MKLQDLNGKWVLFKGVYSDNSMVYVSLNNKVFGFREDPDDGYRSYMVEEGLVQSPKKAAFSFGKKPVKLFARTGDLGSFDGLALFLNEEDHEAVAQFGTDHSDDYYPMARDWVDVQRINEELFPAKRTKKKID
jgi:hypothetical protein